MVDTSRDSVGQPSMLRQLSDEDQLRLTEILDEYLRQLEQGESPNPAALVATYPQLGAALTLYLEKLNDLYRMTGGQEQVGSDMRGRVLGDYRLDEEIGRGGMGIVFSAEQQSLRRRVAVKLLPMVAMLDVKFVERFRNEARAAASLEHPNIVPVYSVGEEAGIHFFAMRLIDGHSLDERIATHNENGTHPPTLSALAQFADIADALHVAHEYGIVHRDIKPSNLLLDNPGKLWVADFGLARFQDGRALTGTGEMIGTMRYMSPEQANGRSELVDHRTDIYSLGATLYELLTGNPAVPGEEGPSLLRTITSHTPVRIRKLRSELPADLQTVIDKAMAKHRDDRYANASEMAADLRRVVRGEPVSTKLVSPIVIVARWTSSNPALVSAAVAICAALGLMLSTGTYMVNRTISDALQDAQSNLRKVHALQRERAETIDSLAMIPGVEKFRRRLIQTELRYYQEYVKQPQGAAMQDELAQAYTRMGTLNEELGQVAEAVGAFQRAESIYSELANRDELRYGLSFYKLHRQENLNHMAMALDQAGDTVLAAELLLGSLQQLRAENAESTFSEKLLIEYAMTENNYGLLLQKMNATSEPSKKLEAVEALENSAETLTNQLAQSPENQACKRGLAAALHNLGSIYAKSVADDEQARGLTFYREALALQLELASETDNRLRASIDLLTTYLNIGNLHLRRSETLLACEAFDRSAKIGRRLVEISPQVDTYRRDLAVCLSNLGMARYKLGDSNAAREHLQESVHHYRNLLIAYPEHAGLQASLGIALNNQGMVLQQSGEGRAAEDAYRRAASLLEALSPLQSEALNKVYVNHVRMLKDAGRDDEADQLVRRQMAFLEAEKGNL